MIGLTVFRWLFIFIIGASCCAIDVSSLYAAGAPTDQLAGSLPKVASDCTAARADAIQKFCGATEAWAGDLIWNADFQRAPLAKVRELVASKEAVDAALAHFFSLRGKFTELPAGEAQRESARQYLRSTSQLIDLSGRLRYLLRDAIDGAASAGDANLALRTELLDFLLERRVSIGASAVSYLLFDPPAENGYPVADTATRQKVFALFGMAGEPALLDDIADIVGDDHTPPDQLVYAVAAAQEIGVPQNPLPGSPEQDRPALTAARLRGVLARIDSAKLSPALREKSRGLQGWLWEREKQGVSGDTFRVGHLELRSGDWFLMRNPSPYNRFTDLSPGLFTHVGVVAVQKGSDGVRRFVIVDLPERGDKIPAMNVDAYLAKTLHFAFLRHKDPAAGEQMGAAAASIIGNETQFDLSFRTERVFELKGQSLAGKTIHTYCAGLLVLMGQQTQYPRENFFPISERPAGGNCLANLAKLGMSIGADFNSPTGALFSPNMILVGQREPMYEPGREVQEAVYDYFAEGMVRKTLVPSPDVYQSLRLKLAEASKTRPWLARRLAQANNVSEKMDLESAAKAGMVVEALDQIAQRNRTDFEQAREALVASPAAELSSEGYSTEEIARIANYRRIHAALYEQFSAGKVPPRGLRVALVEYYISLGQRQVDERFFGAP